ncbi:hypothetical protein [Micromonospora sp. WMMD737]|uniref:hypothetical protein n=1 Tax=Micromonospora sp. WMMD737 TaxID=3404113 RepID=UPI003B9574C0
MQSPAPITPTAPSLAAGFPAHLQRDVQTVTKLLPPPPLNPALPFRVTVDGQPLIIPYRIYEAEPSAATELSLSPTQLAILNCLYTRHHDGRVRQRRLGHILRLNEPWVVPFVVRLVGEYVLEILLDIRRELVELDDPTTPQHAVYGQVLAANPSFLAITRQQAASYWACYHRHLYSDRRYYPGSTLIKSVQAAARHYSTPARSRSSYLDKGIPPP